MQRIVIDTNVIVSALIGSSYPTQIIFDLVFGKKVSVCLSSEIFAEYIEVLHRQKFIKYTGFVANAEIVLTKIDELSVKYTPTTKLAIIKDKSDNRFLELGITANADFFNHRKYSSFQLYGIRFNENCYS